MSTRNDSSAPLVLAAREIARSMEAAVEGKAAETRVDTDAATFRKIAAVLNGLSTHLSGCGGTECMGRPIDGVRFWVAQERLKAEQARVAMLSEENSRLKTALQSIADGDLEELRLARLFGEPVGIVHQVRDFAGRALGNA
jgi:hypothetical protein